MSTDRQEKRRWGMVLARPRGLITAEPFWSEVIDGIEEELQGTGIAFLLHQVPSTCDELAVYRRWAREGFVTGVAVVDPLAQDPRPTELAELDLKVLYAGVEEPLPGRVSIVSDNSASARLALKRLAELGHRRLARVSGPARLAHTGIRDRVCREVATDLGLDLETVTGDYSEASGRTATRALLGREAPTRPTAILYDNDTMALAGLREAADRGVEVPRELSIVSWDDSPACRLASPPLSVIAVDVHEFGRRIARCMLRLDAGEEAFTVPEPAHRWLERESVTGAPAPR